MFLVPVEETRHCGIFVLHRACRQDSVSRLSSNICVWELLKYVFDLFLAAGHETRIFCANIFLTILSQVVAVYLILALLVVNYVSGAVWRLSRYQSLVQCLKLEADRLARGLVI